jgi:hypothetical protein
MLNHNNTFTSFVQSFVTEEHIFCFDYMDLEEITNEMYGKRIEIVNSPNDSNHQYQVQEVNDQSQKKSLEAAIHNGYIDYSHYGCILNDLCQKKHLLPGSYIVKISW